MLGELAKQLFQAKEVKADLNNRLKSINEIIKSAEKDLADAMDEAKLDKFSSEHGTISKKVELYPQVEDWEDFLKWTVENNRFDFVQRRVNSAPFKEFFDQNSYFPDGLDSYEKLTISTRKN